MFHKLFQIELSLDPSTETKVNINKTSRTLPRKTRPASCLRTTRISFERKKKMVGVPIVIRWTFLNRTTAPITIIWSNELQIIKSPIRRTNLSTTTKRNQDTGNARSQICANLMELASIKTTRHRKTRWWMFQVKSFTKIKNKWRTTNTFHPSWVCQTQPKMRIRRACQLKVGYKEQ